MNNKGELDKRTLISLFIAILILVAMFLVLDENIDPESEECGNSKYNIYSNATTGYMKVFNKCYVDDYFVQACFRLDNGGRC